MKFDAVIFEGDNLANFADPDIPSIRFYDVNNDELKMLMLLAARQKHMFICCLPYLDEA
jgi:hypothetical protein